MKVDAGAHAMKVDAGAYAMKAKIAARDPYTKNADRLEGNRTTL